MLFELVKFGSNGITQVQTFVAEVARLSGGAASACSLLGPKRLLRL